MTKKDFDVQFEDKNKFSVDYHGYRTGTSTGTGTGTGGPGPAGPQGPQGIYQVNLYLRAASKPDTPADVTWTNGVLSGANASSWATGLPVGSDRTWRVSASHDPASPNTPISTWGRVQLADVPTTASEVPSVPSGSLTASNVQSALNELQAEMDVAQSQRAVIEREVRDAAAQRALLQRSTRANTAQTNSRETLTGADRRKLNQIAESQSSTSFAGLPSGNLAYSDGESVPSPTGGFNPSLPNRTGSPRVGKLFFEVPSDASIMNAVIRVFNRNGTAIGDPIDVGQANREEDSSGPGIARYLSPTDVTIPAISTAQLQLETVADSTFTLSSRYRVPSSIVTGLVNGQKGDKGDQGAQGAYTVRIYTRHSTTPAPTGVTWVPASGATAARLTNTGTNTVWSLNVPGLGVGDLWESTATFDPASTATGISDWSPAFQAGSTGPAGPQGIQGERGPQGSYTVRLYRRSGSDVLRPTGLTWTAATGVLSGTGAVGWSTSIPQGAGEPVWETNATFNPSGSATTITAWGLPFRLTGPQGATGPAGSGGALSSTQTRKLSSITEISSAFYDTAVGMIRFSYRTNRFLTFTPASGGVQSYTNSANNSVLVVGVRLFNVPVETDLSLLEWRVRDSGGTVVARKPFNVSSFTGGLETADYEADLNNDRRVNVGPNQTLFLAHRASIPTTFTLSENYRVPATIVTDLVENALAPTNFRKLADITEDTTVSYTDLVGGQLAFQQATPVFTNTLTSASASGPSGRVFFEVPTDTPLTNLSIREYDSSGTFVNECPVVGLTKQTSFSAGKDRYLTVVTMTLAAGVTARLQASSTTYDTYTLSDKYRIPASGVTGLPVPERGETGARGDQGTPSATAYMRLPDVNGGGAVGAQQSAPARPTQLTWTASTGVLSGTDATNWSTTVPSGSGLLWGTSSVYNPSAPAGTITTWSQPFRLTGPDGATGPKGADAMLSGTQTRKLSSITEVSATTYDTMIGSIGFSPQFTINRFYSARQQPSYTNGSTSSTFRMAAARLWDVPMETDLSLLEWRVRRADGEVVSRQPFGTFQNTRRLHMYDYEGDVNPSIPVAPGQTLYISRRDNIPTTFTLSQEYRVPAQVVTDLVDNALAPTNFRKLSDVTEGTTVTYANLTAGRLAFNPSSGTPVFTSTLTSTSTGGPTGRVLFEVPTDTPLTNLSIREYAADGTFVNECPLDGLTKQTSFSSGMDRYLTVVTLTLAAGVTARIQTSTTTSDTFTLSEKYRVPSVDVMRTPTALTSTTLEGALEELRTNIDNIPSGGGSGGSGGSLSGTDARKLGDITEVATRSYADTTGGTVAPSSGANPPVPVGSFAASYVATSALTDNFFFEVTAGQSISSAVLRVFNSSNVAVGSPIRVSGATAQTDSSNGKDRYLTTQDITVPAGGRVRIQTETVTPTTFTLSSKYRIPASGVTGLPSSSQGSQGRYRVNLYRATSDTNVTTPVVTWTASSGALSGTDATSWSTTQPSGTLPVWRTSAEFDPSGSDTTITTWATPFRLTGPQGAQGATGNPGAAGAQGAQGSYTVRIYTRSQSTPAPSGVTWVPASGANAARLTNTGSPTTWSLTVPSNPTIGALWEATATFDPSSSATGINAWSGAFQAGSTGPAGPQGTQGEQGSYTVRLYQRSTSTTVAMPSNLTWTASTGALSGTQASSWSTTIPAGTDPVWETNAVFNPSGSATTITSWGIPFRLTGPAGTGSGTSLSASNGRKLSEITEADGFSYTQVPGSELGGNTSQFSPAIMGITSSFSINIFVQVPDTLTITDDIRFRHISGTGTVKTDVALSSLTLQTGAPAGRVRYRTATQVALTPGDTIRIFSRTTGRTYTLSSKYRIPAGSIVGTTSGAKGDQGAQGSYLVRLYKRSSTAITATPADVTWTSPGTLGGANAASWALTIPAGTDPLYSVTANFNPASPATISIWSSVFSVGGIAGTDGADGAAGAQGRYTVRLYQRSTSTVVRPTLLAWTAATGSLSGSHAADWETTIPTGQDPLWETNAVFDPASGATTIAAWSLPIRLTGPKGDKGDTGPAGTGGALSASNTRKLAEITEATRADTFANEPLSGISVAANVGGTLTPRDTGTSWSPTFTGGTGASGERLFFEIDDGATLTDLFMRVFNQDGSLNMSLSVSDAVSQSNPNTGKLRYLASQTFNNPTNGTIRLQRRSAGTLGYTLSDNYIVPADIVSGLAAGKVTNTATGNLTATTVQGALNELQTEIDDLPSPEESETFFDHVELTGTLSNLSISADFYYLPLGDLPERDLSKWTHVTNSQFPQPTLTAYTQYVVLLNNAKYPNMITWNPAPSQPVDSATNATPANITYGGFDQVDGLHVPEGYEGFEFLMPSWNAASTLLTGARLQVGDLTRGNVSRVDLSSAIKVTDDNLDISNPTTSLTEIQREKLQGLQLKTYTQPAVTEGKPSANYKLVAASAWPDPAIDYSTFDPRTNATLGQDPSSTGIRENQGGRTGLASFFNLITDTEATFNQPNPTTRGYNTLYNQQYSRATEYADCAGVWGGTISAVDNTSDSSFRVDDGRGLFSTMTLHLPPDLSNGSYPIMNIGNSDEDGNHALVLRKNIDDTYPPGNSLAVRRFSGPPTSTTSNQYVTETLGAPNGATRQIFRADGGLTGGATEDISHDWIFPASLTASSAAPARVNMHVRVWDNGSDEGEHDFTSSLPASIQSITNLGADNPAGINNPGGTDFVLSFIGAGFPRRGPQTVTCNVRYTASDSSVGNQRAMEITFNDLSDAGIYYEVRIEVSTQQSVTTPAGTFREDVIIGGVPDGASEIGFYAYATGAAGSRRMNYRAAINGRSGDLEIDDFSGNNARVPLGRVPVTFGHASSPPTIAVNRFAIFKPTGVLSIDDMNHLTAPAQRNRPDVGGLVRHGGKTFHEVFSPAYKSTIFTSGVEQNLAHPVSGTDRTSANRALGVNLTWTNANLPPEIQIGSGLDELNALTDFTASLTADIGVLFDDSALHTPGSGRTISPSAFLLLRATLQEKLAGGAWTPMPGPELAVELRAQTFDDGAERPAGLEIGGDALLRRSFSTVAQFKTGASYRIRVTGYRLSGAGNQTWPTAASVVKVAANQSFLMMDISPAV